MRAAFSAAMILSVIGISGCSPASAPLLAVEKTEAGGTRLLIAPCPGYRALALSVFSDSETGPLGLWSLSNKARVGSPGEVELFTPPGGWDVNTTTLTELRNPDPYVAKVDGAIETRGLDGRVEFTVEKINNLGAGEVLTGTKGEKVMDRAKFLKPSSGRCKP